MAVTVTEVVNSVVVTPDTNTVVVSTPGPAGADGQGVPVGGSTGQVLSKVNSTNYNTQWSSATSGTVTSITPASDGGSGTAITGAGTITIAGGNVLTSTTSGTTITVNHDAAGSTGVGKSYPSSITVDSYGHVVGSGSTVTPLVASNNLSDVTASTARSNLGLGTAALVATGTGDANAILGNDARLSDARTPTDHSTAKLTSGTLVVGRGGTGLTAVTTLLNSNTTKSDVGLSAVENTAVSSWAGTSNITTLGTVGTGTWNATAILDTKIDLRVDHGVTFDGGGSVIESAKVVYVPVERAGVIKAATLVGDASGSITITITKYDPAADATTLGSAAAVGSIVLATKIIKRDTTLSGWTLAVAEGDVLAFTTGGTIATVTRVTCKLKVELA